MATKKLQILDSLNKNAVLYTPQELTEEERAQVRENLAIPSLDENGKIPTSQLPDDIGPGGGLTEVSWEDVKNKPFEDTRVMSRYSYAENSNPISFDCAAMNYSLYKISDLVLTKEEIFNAKIKIGNRELEKFSENNILIETNEIVLAQSLEYSNDFAFLFCNTIGTCNFTFSGYPLSVDVPEVGIYRVNGLGLGMSDISTIEIFVSGELKTLDLKYLPENMALGYDTRIRSYYSQAENPNPPQIDNAMMNMSCYKVSDLVPTRTEIFNSTKLIVNGQEYILDESGIQLETDDFIYVYETKMMFGFIFVNKSGTLNFTASGYPMSIEIPEGGEGIYYQRQLNAGVPEGRTIEFIIGGELKQIDPKFIPADLDFNLDDYYTKSEVYNKSETSNLVTNNLARYYTKSETYTKSEVDTAIDNIDLSRYYTKDEIYSKSEVDNALNNIGLSNYYTKTESDNLYYTESEVNSAIKNNNLSYYTKSEIDAITGDIDIVLDEISALIGE